MKFLKKIAVIFLAVLEVITNSRLVQAAEAPVAAAEAAEENVHLHDDNSAKKSYLRIGIMIDGQKDGSGEEGRLVSVTDYSSYPLYAIYYKEGDTNGVPLDGSKVNWHGVQISSSTGEEAAINNGKLWTGAVTGEEITIKATYKPLDGEELEATCKIKVQNLNLDPAQKETLQCAALCLAVGTDFKNDDKGISIGELLKKSPSYLNQQNDYIIKKQQTGATFASFYSATISDWKLIDYRNDITCGFHAALFKDPSGNYALSYRGTESGSLVDFWNDWRLGTGQGCRQLNSGLNYYKDMKKEHNNITMLTGHSLGGGIANYVSDLENVKAITFNSPSTMVSAINVKHTDFAKNFTGVHNTRRTDFANIHDWVGNTGIGDNKKSTKSQRESIGQFKSKVNVNAETSFKGGLVDKTVFVADQSNINGSGSFLPYHSFEQLLSYDISKKKFF